MQVGVDLVAYLFEAHHIASVHKRRPMVDTV